MSINRMTTRPLDVPRSRRRWGLRGLTSMPAGKVVPLGSVPLLREDSAHGRYKINFEMMETAELLMNAVYVRVYAHLVPWLAFERFGGSMDVFNKSYAGLPPFDGEAVIPFFETHAMGAHGSKPLYKYLGKHGQSGDLVNTMELEAYNLIWNMRAENRSKDIPKRGRLDATLAPAFWAQENFPHLVADFDQAVIDGEVALNFAGFSGSTKIPVKGIGLLQGADAGYIASQPVRESGGTATYAHALTNHVRYKATSNNGTTGLPDITVDVGDILTEMVESGISISLSTIEQARKMQAFARIREQYVGHSDDYIIDMLMSGVSIPDQALKQPMLLGTATNVFGMAKRYSTDADALTASAVNGASMAEIAVHVPRLGTGGVIMLTAEVTPEQMFERRRDPFFHLGSVDKLPDYVRDELDEEKVDVVTNADVDTAHATPAGVFGYEPMNARWDRMAYQIGGEFYRPSLNTTEDEIRQRLWAVETVDPTLSADFFLATNIHQKPFLDTLADPFHVVTVGETLIEGNTVFGGVLVEAMNNYDEVRAKAPTEQIEK